MLVDCNAGQHVARQLSLSAIAAMVSHPDKPVQVLVTNNDVAHDEAAPGRVIIGVHPTMRYKQLKAADLPSAR
jgi:hypothetical protein